MIICSVFCNRSDGKNRVGGFFVSEGVLFRLKWPFLAGLKRPNRAQMCCLNLRGGSPCIAESASLKCVI